MKTPAYRLFATALLALVLLAGCGPGLEGGSDSPVTGDEAPEGLGQDPCLQGTWEMTHPEVNALMASLAYIPGLTIPTGTLVLSFTGDEFAYGSRDLVMRIDNPGGYLEAEAVFLHYGNFATTGGMLITTNVVSNAEAMTWRAVIDGETTEAPGPNAVFFPLPGGGPYDCSGDALAIDSLGGTTGTVTLIFFRQP